MTSTIAVICNLGWNYVYYFLKRHGQITKGISLILLGQIFNIGEINILSFKAITKYFLRHNKGRYN